MKSKTLLIVIALLVAVVAGVVIMQNRKQDSVEQTKPPATETASQIHSPSTPASEMAESHHVPAHYKVAPALTELRPVLASSQFTGKAREAYDAVSNVPSLIAQMPCYCHCDRGMGHKSLHSCFEDDHAAHCAVCVDEALMAYQLQQKGLSASEIREQIIAKFSGD